MINGRGEETEQCRRAGGFLPWIGHQRTRLELQWYTGFSGESYTLLRFLATQGSRQCYHHPHRPEEESEADELAQATPGFNLILAFPMSVRGLTFFPQNLRARSS